MPLLSEMLETISSLKICSMCKKGCTKERSFDCGHILCNKCSRSRDCIACRSEVSANMSPSMKFISELYEQLSNISSEKRTEKRERENGEDHIGKQRKRQKYLNKRERKTPELTASDDSSQDRSVSPIRSTERQLTFSKTSHSNERTHFNKKKESQKPNRAQRKRPVNNLSNETLENESSSEYNMEVVLRNEGRIKVNELGSDVAELIERYKRGIDNDFQVKEEILIKEENFFDYGNCFEMPKLEREDPLESSKNNSSDEDSYVQILDEESNFSEKSSNPLPENKVLTSDEECEGQPPPNNPSVNVVLMRTSENCYRVKENTSSPLSSKSYSPSSSSSKINGQHTTTFLDSSYLHSSTIGLGKNNSLTLMNKEHSGNLTRKDKTLSRNGIKNDLNNSPNNFQNSFIELKKGNTDPLGNEVENSSSLLDSSPLNGGDKLPPISSSSSPKQNVFGNKRTENFIIEPISTSIPELQPRSVFTDTFDFLGFTETDVISSSVQHMLMQMALTSSSTSSYTFEDKEIIIRKRSSVETAVHAETPSNTSVIQNSVEPSAQAETPRNTPGFQMISPVDEAERSEVNATGFFENSVLDVGEISSSTPQVRSRRQLTFQSPRVHTEDDLSSIDELDEDLQATAACIQLNGNAAFHEQLEDLFLQSEFSIREEQPVNLTFTMCCLTSCEKELVKRLAELTRSSISEEVSHKTTHLIVGKGAENRDEYLLAIAYRAYIVTMDWVYSCLGEQSIVSPVDYILESDDGPQRCIEPIPHLFQDFWILFNAPLQESLLPTYQLTQMLCTLGRGKVFINRDNWTDILEKTAFPRFFVFVQRSQLTPELLEKCEEGDTVPVSFMWVITSIRAYCAQPIIPFLGADISRTLLASKYLVPHHLLRVSTQAS